MTQPSDLDVIRCIRGERVFGPGLDERIRTVGEVLPARLLFDVLRQCASAHELVEATWPLAVVARTGDVQWEERGIDAGDEGEDDDAPPPREQRIEACFRIRFADDDAAFYMNEVLAPPDPTIEYVKFRRGAFHYWQVSVASTDDLDGIEAEARDLPFVEAVERISADAFWNSNEA